VVASTAVTVSELPVCHVESTEAEPPAATVTSPPSWDSSSEELERVIRYDSGNTPVICHSPSVPVWTVWLW
jgi:hypothetical protein